MQTKVAFKLIGERHDDMCIDGVQLNVMELLIYLIKHFGLEEKARASSCEIAITVDGVKLDDYCIHVTCGFKMMDKDACDPLTGKLVLPTIQSSNNVFLSRPSSRKTTDPHTTSSCDTFLKLVKSYGMMGSRNLDGNLSVCPNRKI
jgi:hypothetical protein